MKAAREAWFEGQLDLDPAKLIFIDETGASTKMARLRGRAKRGQRRRAAVPHGHWKTTTFTAGLSLNVMVAPMVLDGPMNGDAFLAYIHKFKAALRKAAARTIPELGDVVAEVIEQFKPAQCKNYFAAAGNDQD